MIKKEQNISFTGILGNYKMKKVLKSALAARKAPSVNVNYPLDELLITKKVSEAVTNFVKESPNKKSYEIALKIAEDFPLIKHQESAVKNTQKLQLSDILENHFSELSKLREHLNKQLDAFLNPILQKFIL